MTKEVCVKVYMSEEDRDTIDEARRISSQTRSSWMLQKSLAAARSRSK